MAVCFDSSEKTHREKKFAEYKIQRPSMPDDLRSQIPVIKDVIEAFSIPVFEKGGYEADDIIATITKKATQKDLEVVIVSDDKDMYQLADRHIKYYNSKSGSILSEKDVKDKLGFAPQLIADFIGLAGDNSDNIPGVAGIGTVGARQLINEFGSLDAIFKHVQKLEKPAGKEKLIFEQHEAARFSKELAILDDGVPVKFSLKDLRVQSPDKERLHLLFRDLEFRKLAEEFSSTKQPSTKVNVASVKKPADLKPFISDVNKKGFFEGLAVFTALFAALGSFGGAAISMHSAFKSNENQAQITKTQNRIDAKQQEIDARQVV